MNKAERSARAEFRRAFGKALIAAAKPTRFQTSRGSLYQIRDDWFVAVDIRSDQQATHLIAHIKPMAIDPIFWDAMDKGEEWRRPLWKRHLGLTLRDPPFAEVDFEEHDDPAAAAAHAIVQAEEWASATSALSLGDFLDRCAAAEQRPFQHFECIATTLVAMGRNDDALALCRAAAAAGESGGFRSNGQKFIDLLAALIERRCA